MKKDLICVACPVGCQITVTLDAQNGIQGIEGNGCKRGIAYATAEISNPTRSLTTTMAVTGAKQRLVSVKSAAPLPKALLQDCVRLLSGQRVPAPVKIGDVLVQNVMDTGVDIVATSGALASV